MWARRLQRKNGEGGLYPEQAASAGSWTMGCGLGPQGMRDLILRLSRVSSVSESVSDWPCPPPALWTCATGVLECQSHPEPGRLEGK